MISKSSPRFVTSSISLGQASILLTPIDIVMPMIYSPLLLAFSSPVPQGFVSDLEQAMRQALCHYRDFSGRIKRNESGKIVISLDEKVNDRGVLWIEAVTEETLEGGYLSQDHHRLHDLTPMSSGIAAGTGIPLLLQITRFSCGGLALGFGVHHQAVDCNAFPGFLLELAKLTRDPTRAAPCLVDRSSLAPRCPPSPSFDHVDYNVDLVSPLPPGSASIATRRILFTKEKLEVIKSESNQGLSKRVSTFVSLAAYLWKLIVVARGTSSESRTLLNCPVNGRRGLSLPDEFFGNAVFKKCVSASVRDLIAMPLNAVAPMVAASLELCSQAEHLQSTVDFLALKHQQQDVPNYTEEEIPQIGFDPNLVVTSWARLPLYETDFGFGPPVLAIPTDGPCEGYVRVAPSREGDGSLVVVPTLRTDHLDRLMALITT